MKKFSKAEIKKYKKISETSGIELPAVLAHFRAKNTGLKPHQLNKIENASDSYRVEKRRKP